MLGRTVPRIWTPPQVEGPPGPCGCGCALTPATSVGFDQDAFASEMLGRPFLPWQRWLVIHAGELLPDGRPRFRIVHVQVARQNGKTEVPAILSLYWQTVDQFGEYDDAIILGTSTKLDYAKESWMKAIRYAEAGPGLVDVIPSHRAGGAAAKKRRREWTRQANGEQESELYSTRYKIAPANEEGGRSLTIARLVLDELRQHHTYDAWAASVPATNAVPRAQVWTLSNAGTDRSVVLNDERAAALAFIDTGDGDPRRGWFEWSAPEDADPLNVEALAQANPSLGYLGDVEALLSDASTAVRLGGEALGKFRTEVMCLRVRSLDPAIDAAAWVRCGPTPDRPASSLAPWRRRVALCADLSLDGLHATVYAAAAAPGGLVHIDPVADWSGPDAAAQLRRALPGIVARVRPRAFGWFPSGPAAAVAAALAERPGRAWPPAGVTVAAIREETAAVCMGLAELVKAEQLRHPNDPLLNAQVATADKAKTGARWVFERGDVAYVDAVYAAAGAVHLARTLPADPGRIRIVTPD